MTNDLFGSSVGTTYFSIWFMCSIPCDMLFHDLNCAIYIFSLLDNCYFGMKISDRIDFVSRLTVFSNGLGMYSKIVRRLEQISYKIHFVQEFCPKWSENLGRFDMTHMILSIFYLLINFVLNIF